MEIVLNLLYFYIALYSVFFFVQAIKNLNDTEISHPAKILGTVAQNNLCVIIYSHNNKISLETF